jgi:hypothetical protein
MSFTSSNHDVIMHPADPAPDGIDVGGKAGSQTEGTPFVPDVPKPQETKDPSLDLLDRIPNLYRLLDLRNDDGSGGIGQ